LCLDKDKDSGFYFKVIKTEVVQSGKTYCHVEVKPYSHLTSGASSRSFEITSLSIVFDEWLKHIREYDSLKNLFSDPVIRQYEEFFSSKFQMAEEDAGYAPFDPIKQLQLNKWFEIISVALEESKTEENSTEVDEIIVEVKELSARQSKLSKSNVVKGIARFWAKIFKVSTPFAKEVVKKSKDEGVKRGINWLLDKLLGIDFNISDQVNQLIN
jgi:tRNA nucleotidyltransferase/poly(A) polymerase